MDENLGRPQRIPRREGEGGSFTLAAGLTAYERVVVVVLYEIAARDEHVTVTRDALGGEVK